MRKTIIMTGQLHTERTEKACFFTVFEHSVQGDAKYEVELLSPYSGQLVDSVGNEGIGLLSSGAVFEWIADRCDY